MLCCVVKYFQIINVLKSVTFVKAVQENMPENHFPRVQLPAAGSNISFHEPPRSTEMDVIGDDNRNQESNS